MRLIPQPYSIELTGGTTQLREITKRETVSGFGEEEYELLISPGDIVARANTDKGFYYADITLKQIASLYGTVPCMKIHDKPRYQYRGFMIDCARHIFSVEELKKMISAAADVKFNKFHWHLSDDQGFRIELDSLPELTEKGSVRDCDSFINCKSDKPYSGYFRKEEIREIIAFCRERFIDVIPEIDMPGHQSAFLHVYPEFTCKGDAVKVKTTQGIFKDIICAGNKEAKEYLKKILDEICELFPYDTVHIGGDEVPKSNWKTCEKCSEIMAENGLSDYNDLQCIFINEMAGYLKNKGKRCIVWNDCLKGKGLFPEIAVQHWQKGPELTSGEANKGRKTILSPFNPFYVDYPYGMHPLKAAYKYEPEKLKGLNSDGKKSIIGVESPIWTEHINNNERLEYMCFPRWFSVAECGWTAKHNKNYAEFYEVLLRLCKLYREKGLNIAPEEDWNPPVLSRLSETIKFFLPKK